MADKESSETKGGGILPPEKYIKKIRDLQTKNGKLQAKYNVAIAERDDLQGRIQGLMTVNEILREQLAANSGDSAERTRLQKQVQDLENKIESFTKQLKEKEDEIKRLNSKLRQVETQLSEWEKMPNNSGEVLRAKEQEIERLKNELEKEQAKLVAKDNEIKSLRKDKADLVRQTNELTKKINLLEAEQTQDLGYNIIWGLIWKGLAVLFDVIVIWLFACCSSGFITTATIMLAAFLTCANVLILTMRILHCISEFTQARFDAITLPANIFGSICLLVVFILIILVFGVGL